MRNRKYSKPRKGSLAFEWLLFATVLVIGVIGGAAAIRDAIIIESAETAGAIVNLNDTYSVSKPPKMRVKYGDEEHNPSYASGFSYQDSGGSVSVAQGSN